ncbi:MAG TPA: phosphoadenylyl-sulfate reductase [Candidatus Limnocylindrales bacterium]|nr:phosphoadenylyl-sulfate reductase [Candidatus Limnocylindrales bacterium]
MADLPASELVAFALGEFGRGFAISTAFQKEGMVLVDMAARVDAAVRVLTLDTGRLPEESLQMIETVRARYGIAVEIVRPDAGEVAGMVEGHGRDLFYKSVEMRELCCEIRKVRPLRRKLAELKAWASGLRRDQAASRANVPVAEMVDGRLKLNPLALWTAEQVEQYTREHDVPVHPLYAKGYTTIGCAPCTRAIEAGEEERAGRWWWESGAHKECGIHISPAGVVRRA